jgi:hypothetical protein
MNTLKYWLEVLASCVAILGTIIGLWFGLSTYSNDVENKRKETTIQYLVGFSDMLAKTDPVLLDTINFFNNKDSDNNLYSECGRLNRDTLKKILQENKTYRPQLDNIMVYLNQLAIGCKEGFYDEHTAWYSNHYRIINATNAIYPYIELRAKEEKYSGDNKPCGFLRNMVNCWHNGLGKYGEWDKKDREESRKIWKETRRMEEED